MCSSSSLLALSPEFIGFGPLVRLSLSIEFNITTISLRMAHDVFISHAYRDKPIAVAICKKLESAQVGCWIAEREVSAGGDWTEATRNAIASSRVMVLLLRKTPMRRLTSKGKSRMPSIPSGQSSQCGSPKRHRSARFFSISEMLAGSTRFRRLRNSIWKNWPPASMELSGSDDHPRRKALPHAQ